ncbi:MAG: D-lyxose/D-mannose family sugar isomerase [Firmicutes bacterium]|nr:D-lyxose/D-mannose family sugar isomerase [Bacillota bacterium]
MKRSELNAILCEGIEFIKKMNFHLPPFAYWSPEEWKTKGHEYDEIRDNLLGWDITDFGSGDFPRVGLLLFTLRNGNLKLSKYKKPYAEKILIARENQITPFHFHWNKMEDIINRGGGNLLVQLYNSTPDENLADTPIQVLQDGRSYTVPAGSIIRLTPGESITLPQRIYHKFWGEKDTVLLGEVSMVNDDEVDNRFLEPAGRFPAIEEDEPPLYLLATEYPKAP